MEEQRRLMKHLWARALRGDREVLPVLADLMGETADPRQVTRESALEFFTTFCDLWHRDPEQRPTLEVLAAHVEKE